MANESYLVTVKKFSKSFSPLADCSSKISAGYRTLAVLYPDGSLYLRHVKSEKEGFVKQVKQFEWSAVCQDHHTHCSGCSEDFLLTVKDSCSIELYRIADLQESHSGLSVMCEEVVTANLLKSLLRDRGKDCAIQEVSVITMTTELRNSSHMATLLINCKLVITLWSTRDQPVQLMSCFALDESPVSFLPVLFLAQVKICHTLIFALFSSGINIIHHIGGQFIGYVDIPVYHNTMEDFSSDEPSSICPPSPSKTFSHLEITDDLCLLVCTDNFNNINTINLDDYFIQYPHHLHVKHTKLPSQMNRLQTGFRYDSQDEDVLLRDTRTGDVTYGDRVWKTELADLREETLASGADTDFPGVSYFNKCTSLQGGRWFDAVKDMKLNIALNNQQPSKHCQSRNHKITGFLLKHPKTDSRSVTPTSETSLSLRVSKETMQSNILCREPRSTFIPAEPWMKSQMIAGLFPASDSLLVWLAPRKEEDPLSGFEFPYGLVCLYSYDGEELSDRQMFLEPTVLVKSCASLQPVCALTHKLLSIPSFGVNQNQLVHQVIMYENAALAESLCRINNWNHCVIPLEALQVALKHRQLDTVAFFLKNQENVFTSITSLPPPSPSMSLSPQYSSSPSSKVLSVTIDTSPTEAVVNALAASVKKNALQQHNLHFTSQLLQMTLTYLHGLIEDGSQFMERHLTTPVESDPGTQTMESRNPINVLLVEESLLLITQCIVELRHFLSNLPEDTVKVSAGVNRKEMAFESFTSESSNMFEKWSLMACKDIVSGAVVSGNIAMAQAFFLNNLHKKEAGCDGSLVSITDLALNLMLTALVRQDLETATKILINMGRDVTDQLRSICFHTIHRPLRDSLVNKLDAEGNLSTEEKEMIKFVYALETLYHQQSFDQAKRSLSVQYGRWTDLGMLRNSFNLNSTHLMESHIDRRSLLTGHSHQQDQASGGYAELLLDWVMRWDSQSCQQILLERMLCDRDSSRSSYGISAEAIWKYFCSHGEVRILKSWVRAMAIGTSEGDRDLCVGDEISVSKERLVLPPISRVVYSQFPACIAVLNDVVVDELTRHGMFTTEQLSNFSILLYHMRRTHILFHRPHPLQEVHSLAITNLSWTEGSNELEPSASDKSDATEITSLKEFHGRFIAYCIEMNLVNVLYYYLDYYRLCESSQGVRDLGLHVNQPPWVDMMVAFRLAGQHPDDCGSVFCVSLSNARLTVNMDNPSVSGMLRAGCPIMAFASLVYGPQPISQAILPAGYWPVEPTWQVEDILLRRSLSVYPKLLSALFPIITSVHGMEPQDITVYQLLQGNSPFEVSRMFGWQQTNELAVKSDMVCDMPHFSSAPLVSHHSHMEKLTFSYYLRHGRPCFAFTAFVGVHLKERGIPRARIIGAARKAYRVAIQQFTDTQVISSCIAFIEMLGMDSAYVRVDLQVANRILAHGGRQGLMGSDCQDVTSLKDRIVCELLAIAGRCNRQCIALLGALDEATHNLISKECLDRTSFEASQRWTLVIMFCRLHKMELSIMHLVDCAKMDKWLQFVCFVQLCQFPPNQVLEVIGQHFSNRHFREHLLLAFENVQVIEVEGTGDEGTRKRGRRKQTSHKDEQSVGPTPTRDVRAQFYARMGLKTTTGPDQGHQSSSAEDDDVKSKYITSHASDHGSSSATEGLVTLDAVRPHTSSNNEGHERAIDPATVPDNLFDVMFSCQSANVPWRALLAHAIALHRATLVVLAACFEEAKPLDCLCAWLYSTLKPSVLEPVTTTLTGLQWRRWCVADLSAIITAIVSHKDQYAATLSQAFYIFDPNNPLLHFLRFHESFVVHFDFDTCFTELDLFKKSYYKLLSLRSGTHAQSSPGTTNDVMWLEKITSLVTQQMLRQCDMFYVQAHLLSLLAKTMFGCNFTCYVPRYYTLNQICKITKEAEIAVDFAAMLQEDSKQTENEKHRVLQALLDSNHFSQAREYANLLNLPPDNITLNEVLHERASIENSVLWEISQGRLAFWHKADLCFTNNRCDPQVAGTFFESQADDPELSYTEKSRLLSMALSWYSRKYETVESTTSSSAGVRGDLERRIWLCCIKAEIEKTKEARLARSISHLEFLPETSEWTLELPEEHRVGSFLETQLEMKSELIQPENVESDADMANLLKTDEELQALEIVLCALLERSLVTQCRRLGAQFSHGCQDLDIVVACIHLAQGTRFSDTLDDSVRRLLSQQPHCRISSSGSISSIKRSGSFVLGSNLQADGSSRVAEDSISVDWVQVEDTITAMEALAYYCQSGRRCCARIITCYKISQTLGLEYEAVVADKPFNVLHSLLVSGFDNRYKLADSYIKSFELSSQEVVGFLADVILHSLRVYTGEELSGSRDELIFNAAPSCDDVIQVIRLCSDQALLGNRLLDTAVNLANERVAGASNNKALNLEVELLVRAHECHTMACNMEGIASVLKGGKRLTTALADAQEYRLMVRLLTGVGRFREMSYIFDTLMKHHHFELLCQKGIDKENKLKVALLEYLKRCYPEDAEKYSMVAVHFNMYREIAEMWQTSAASQLHTLRDQQIVVKPELQIKLDAIMRSFCYAADYYSKEDCLLHSQSCLKQARLVQLQIHLLPSGVRVINLDESSLKKFLKHHTHFFETLLVVDAYDQRGASLWVDSVYNHVVLGGDFKYWQDLKSVMAPTSLLFVDVANKYKNDSPRSSQAMTNMKKLLGQLHELRVRYRIAMDLGFRDMSTAILDNDGGAYLRDVMTS